MTTVTFAVADADNTDASSYPVATFTPSVNDYIVVFSVFDTSLVSGGATFAATDDQSGTYTNITSAIRTSDSTLVCFVRDQLVTSAVGHIITVTCTGDAAIGNISHVYRVSGMLRAGASGVRQSAVQNNNPNPSTPAPVFSLTTLTDNSVLGAVAVNFNPEAVSPPSGWTEGADAGHASPDESLESCYKSSGFVGTTVTFGASVGSTNCALVIELEAAGKSPVRRYNQSQAVQRSTRW